MLYEKEIEKYKKDKYTIELLDEKLINEEQECFINITDESGKREIYINASLPDYIDKLIKSSFFILTKISLLNDKKFMSKTFGRLVIGIQGKMAENGFSFKI